MQYYLRVEGVNLGNFVYDTNNLPTIRGGGLLLLDAVKKVEDKLGQIASNVKAITKGASWGLFRFAPLINNDPVSVRKEIFKFLNEDERLKHATFVVDVLPVEPGSFITKRNQLASLNHWQQMQAPSLTIPQGNEDVCDLCKIRPAGIIYTVGDKPISPSVNVRRQYGQGQKRNEFYQARISPTNEPLEFTCDFKELSSNQTQHGLHQKMAVIYIDGNKFGDFQHKHCKDEDTQERFDQSVREGQENILDSLIKLALADETGKWKTEAGKIRLETLLWGGDEIIWVVPAWLGFAVLDTFYQKTREEIKFIEEKEIKNKKKRKKRNKQAPVTIQKKEHILKHAAGLVFCRHKTPIHRVVRLAKDLAELAKEETNENLVAYQLLESFDHAGTNLKQWRTRRTNSLGNPDDLFINPDNFQAIIKGVSQLKQFRSPEFPRRKLYQIISVLKNDNEEEGKKLLNKLCGEHREILDNLKPLLGKSNVMWLHLIDLWDYMGGQT